MKFKRMLLQDSQILAEAFMRDTADVLDQT